MTVDAHLVYDNLLRSVRSPTIHDHLLRLRDPLAPSCRLHPIVGMMVSEAPSSVAALAVISGHWRAITGNNSPAEAGCSTTASTELGCNGLHGGCGGAERPARKCF